VRSRCDFGGLQLAPPNHCYIYLTQREPNSEARTLTNARLLYTPYLQLCPVLLSPVVVRRREKSVDPIPLVENSRAMLGGC